MSRYRKKCRAEHAWDTVYVVIHASHHKEGQRVDSHPTRLQQCTSSVVVLVGAENIQNITTKLSLSRRTLPLCMKSCPRILYDKCIENFPMETTTVKLVYGRHQVYQQLKEELARPYS